MTITGPAWVDLLEQRLLGSTRWPTPGALAADLDPHTRTTPALDLLDRELVDAAAGATRRLMFFMPPQEGKSERVSRRFPTWLLSRDPTLRVGIVSYELDTAVRWGRVIRRDAEEHPELGIRLRADSRAAGRWETEQGGGVYCVGIGGALTGRPLDVLIVDDPVKGRAEAESRTYREAAWAWWESTAQTRLSSRYRIVLIMTRWHEDDLAGRLLRHEPGDWRLIRVPAVAEDDDPLGRDPGEELTSAQARPAGWFERLRARLSAYVWTSVYQQTPTAGEGNLFRRGDYRYWQPLPAESTRAGATAGRRVDLDGRTVYLDDCWRFVTVDLAASKRTSADYTVAAAWAIGVDGDLILLDRARARLEESEHWNLVRPLTRRWAAPEVFVERGFIGTTLVIAATQAGLQVQPLDADTDKVTRALPATHRVAAHRVWFPAGVDWLDEWCDELAEFPNGAHDDQVDTLAYAVRVAVAHWLPQEPAEQATAYRAGNGSAAAVYEAYSAATGNGHVDPLTRAWD